MESQNPAFGGVTSDKTAVEPALYERVIEGSPDSISIVDRDYVYRMVNSAFLERCRRTREETVGRNAAEIVGRDAFEESARRLH